MRRSSIPIAVLPALGALYFGCTQDFGFYQATQAAGSGGGRSSPSAGAGAAPSSSNTTSSSSVASSSSSGASSSSVASSSSSSTSSSSSGGGCAMPDCANPACAAAYACVPSTPPGWNGPIMLYDGDPATVPACPATDPMAVYHWNGDLMPQPAMCGACTCGAPPVSCTPMALDFSSSAACANLSGTAGQPAPGQCGPIQPPAGTKGYSAAAPVGIAGACTSGGGAKTLPPAQWGRAGLACSNGGLGGGCAGGSICAPKPAAPFVTGLCVWVANDFPCPPGFGDKHSFTSSVVDTRDCSPCSCGAPATKCTATTTVYSDGTCGGTSFAVPDDGTCTAGAASGSIKVAVTASASCPPSGGQPTGTITAGALKTTVCCVP